jgi:hypothetical protein
VRAGRKARAPVRRDLQDLGIAAEPQLVKKLVSWRVLLQFPFRRTLIAKYLQWCSAAV